MSFYQHWILPLLLHLAMKNRELAPYRARLIPEAKGQVIEIGVGSGLNLPAYGAGRVERVVGVDPSPELLAMARKAAAGNAAVPVELLERSAEELPFVDGSFDTAVVTWSLCTIPDPGRALHELRRVLKPGGELLFVEHGLAPDPGVEAWQRRLTPLWTRCSGGCHLNRPIDRLIRSAGFQIASLQTGYMNGLKPMSFMYEGRASSREGENV